MQETEEFSLHKNYICETTQENNFTLNIFPCILLMKKDFHIKKSTKHGYWDGMKYTEMILSMYFKKTFTELLTT